MTFRTWRNMPWMHKAWIFPQTSLSLLMKQQPCKDRELLTVAKKGQSSMSRGADIYATCQHPVKRTCLTYIIKYSGTFRYNFILDCLPVCIGRSVLSHLGSGRLLSVESAADRWDLTPSLSSSSSLSPQFRVSASRTNDETP